MKIILILSLLILTISCGKQGRSKVYPLNDKAITKYVNPMPMPADPNLTLQKSIVNNSYPIQLALYSDGKFYYDLPNLGDGKGTWKKTDGKILLKAKRTLFDMYIEIHGSDEDAQNVSIQFSDRFGPNTLQMTNLNIH
jgi:hypothetical protein